MMVSVPAWVTTSSGVSPGLHKLTQNAVTGQRHYSRARHIFCVDHDGPH
ncbi:hypothetical protein Salmuc_03546 [Salipiger mucosus DSM 16094]|uniref:Uncharacterized protein n=1 Tax=Salipiger mucosus DSM 16094 TaxID=1123237 RepID=S9QAN5_9RHOB|nr:hypothetical protein Salmuc_03546 [Salipiger mucosus DSM 16094]